jgi:hypothetical protein
MIEIPDKTERDAFLASAKGFEKHVWIASGSQRILASSLDRGGNLEDRTTAVHYLKFALPPRLAHALRGAATGSVTLTNLELIVDHPAYQAQAVLPAETILALGQDLEG